MDYAESGDLGSRIEKEVNGGGSGFSERQILDWFTQICLGLKHIHDRKIVHRDIKSVNIFLTKMNTIKIGDFGISKILTNTHDMMSSFVGTWYYLSPEIIKSRPYNFKTDIWSLGVLLYEMCSQKLPFRGRDQFIIQKKIKEGVYDAIPIRFTRDMRSFVDKLLTNDPAKRPSITQLLNFPIIKNRIQLFLNEIDIQKEFSHTILHNYNCLEDSKEPNMTENPERKQMVHNKHGAANERKEQQVQVGVQIPMYHYKHQKVEAYQPQPHPQPEKPYGPGAGNNKDHMVDMYRFRYQCDNKSRPYDDQNLYKKNNLRIDEPSPLQIENYNNKYGYNPKPSPNNNNNKIEIIPKKNVLEYQPHNRSKSPIYRENFAQGGFVQDYQYQQKEKDYQDGFYDRHVKRAGANEDYAKRKEKMQDRIHYQHDKMKIEDNSKKVVGVQCQEPEIVNNGMKKRDVDDKWAREVDEKRVKEEEWLKNAHDFMISPKNNLFDNKQAANPLNINNNYQVENQNNNDMKVTNKGANGGKKKDDKTEMSVDKNSKRKKEILTKDKIIASKKRTSDSGASQKIKLRNDLNLGCNLSYKEDQSASGQNFLEKNVKNPMIIKKNNPTNSNPKNLENVPTPSQKTPSIPRKGSQSNQIISRKTKLQLDSNFREVIPKNESSRTSKDYDLVVPKEARLGYKNPFSYDNSEDNKDVSDIEIKNAEKKIKQLENRLKIRDDNKRNSCPNEDLQDSSKKQSTRKNSGIFDIDAFQSIEQQEEFAQMLKVYQDAQDVEPKDYDVFHNSKFADYDFSDGGQIDEVTSEDDLNSKGTSKGTMIKKVNTNEEISKFDQIPDYKDLMFLGVDDQIGESSSEAILDKIGMKKEYKPEVNYNNNTIGGLSGKFIYEKQMKNINFLKDNKNNFFEEIIQRNPNQATPQIHQERQDIDGDDAIENCFLQSMNNDDVKGGVGYTSPEQKPSEKFVKEKPGVNLHRKSDRSDSYINDDTPIMDFVDHNIQALKKRDSGNRVEGSPLIKPFICCYEDIIRDLYDMDSKDIDWGCLGDQEIRVFDQLCRHNVELIGDNQKNEAMDEMFQTVNDIFGENCFEKKEDLIVCLSALSVGN